MSSTQDRAALETIDSQDSSSGDDSGHDPLNHDHEADMGDVQFTPNSTMDESTPLAGPTYSSVWGSNSQTSQTSTRRASNHQGAAYDAGDGQPRIPRPSAPLRQPSNTYNPIRRPTQFINVQNVQSQINGVRSPSVSRARKDANWQWRAEERAYRDRVRRDQVTSYFTQQSPPSVGYSTETETDDESPTTDTIYEDDPYDQEAQLYFGDDDELQLSLETANVPQNKERLEWHGMLQIVMKGDVVSQEKKRIFGTSEQRGGITSTEDEQVKMWHRVGRRTIPNQHLVEDLWIAFRAKVCGRSIPAQKRMIEEGRSKLDSVMDHITDFSIKGYQRTGKTPMEEVQDALKEVSKIETLFRCWQDFAMEKPRAASEAFQQNIDTIIAWANVTTCIELQFSALYKWVGNEELNFTKTNPSSPNGLGLSDDASFLDRLLKVDGLSALQGEKNMLTNIVATIDKAKSTYVEFKDAFAQRHLPSYIEELQSLINFPTRLVTEVIRLRLDYAKNMKDGAQQGLVNIDQTLAQFKILFLLAVRIKQTYLEIAQPSPGWDIPPCIDENFDSVTLDALRFYFKMLGWKLLGNKNTFKEAEILEAEWEFSQQIGRHFDNGDVEVAEQFSSLTSKLLSRLTLHFEKELQRRPKESISDMQKRYKAVLDSVRVRQRMLFRFFAGLLERFENSTEFNLKVDARLVRQLFDALIETNHFVINDTDQSSVVLIASPLLWDRPKEIQSILGTCSDGDSVSDYSGSPYVLQIYPDEPVYWDGRRQNIDFRDPIVDLRPGRLRLVTDGTLLRLTNARLMFAQQMQMNLDVLIERRANLPRVNAELMKIKKTTYKLSNAILNSVNIIRSQTQGLDCQELIQTCFVFAAECVERSLKFMDNNRRAHNYLRLTVLGIDWIAFVCDDCVAANRQTFRWAVAALEFEMRMTKGQNLLSISNEEWTRLQSKVGACMSLLISHFDIMGARSTLAAQVEAQRLANLTGAFQLDPSKMTDDEQASAYVKMRWLEQLGYIDQMRAEKSAAFQSLGKVLEDSNEAVRSLTQLSSVSANSSIRWQQGQYIGGGTFGSVYAATNLDTGYLMALKEIRLQDPSLVPSITRKIKDEMAVLEVLDHPNIVAYYGNEIHRDKVYIFMEYCGGGSLAQLLEHGRIEDETVTMVYTLQMLEGLAYLHQSGIAHRDIKPENILLDHQGVIKYVDFGAAKLISKTGKTVIDAAAIPTSTAVIIPLPNDGSPTDAIPPVGMGVGPTEAAAAAVGARKSMIGTPMYMSREVVTGTATPATQHAVDVWSLGCVILEMATGRKPWAHLDNEWAILWNIANGNSPQLPSPDQLSPEGIDFLKRCFEVDPTRRPTAQELLQHEWMKTIKDEMQIEPDTPAGSDSGNSNSSETR